MNNSNHSNVLIIGGGCAGISVASRLHNLKSDLSISIVEPSDKSLYQAAWTLVGAGVYEKDKTIRPMADVMPDYVNWINSHAESFSPDSNLVKTSIISILFITVISSSALCQGQSVEPTLLAPSKNVEPSSNDKTPGIQSRPSDFPNWMQADPLKPPLPAVNPAPPSARARVPIKINVEELGRIDSDSVGVLTEEQGGFGFNMWDGTNRSLVEKLLTKLPVNSSSRTIRVLMRRLLLSAAKSPTNITAIDKEISSPVSPLPANGIKADGKLLILRIERLAAMYRLAIDRGDTNSHACRDKHAIGTVLPEFNCHILPPFKILNDSRWANHFCIRRLYFP